MASRDGKPPLPPSARDLSRRLLAELEIPAPVAGMARAVLAWGEAVGEPAASHSRAVSFAGKTLVVEADDPGWTQELSMRKVELLSRLAAVVGKGVVEDLRFALKRG